MENIQSITDAWGRWIAGKRGTGCRFTASTNYASQSDLANYFQYQCAVEVLTIRYDDNSPPTAASKVAYELWYDNATSIQQSEIFSYATTTEQAFAWSITEALSIGVEVSATESVPGVASSTQKISVGLSLSSTQGATSTQSQTWTVNNPVQVPARSSVKCTMTTNTQSYSINFTESVNLTGYVAIWFNDRQDWNGNNDYHWLWFIPIADVMNDVIANGLIDTTGYEVVNGGVRTTARGTFSGSQGISVGVSTVEYPLRPHSASRAASRPATRGRAYPGLTAGADDDAVKRAGLIAKIGAARDRHLQKKTVLSSRDTDVIAAVHDLEDALPSEFAGVKRWFLPIAPVMPQGEGRYAVYFRRLDPRKAVSRSVDHQSCELKIVVSGSIVHDGEILTAGDWLWAPSGSRYGYEVGDLGAVVMTQWPYSALAKLGALNSPLGAKTTSSRDPALVAEMAARQQLDGLGDDGCRFLPFAPAMPDGMTDGRFFQWMARIEPDTTIPVHAHTLEKLADFKVVIGGSISFNGRNLTAGDWMWVPSGQGYTFTSGKQGALLMSNWPWN